MNAGIGARSGRDREARERREAQLALFDSIPEGAEIGRIRPSARDATRWTIRVDGRVVATLDGREVDRLGLREGGVWTPEMCDAVREACALDEARKFAKASLARRACSRSALIGKLRGRAVDETIAERVCDEMERIGLLDDPSYADSLARDRVSRGPVGRRLLEQKLRAKGLDRQEIAGAVERALEGSDPLEDALRLASARAARFGSELAREARIRRLTGLLARRGFEPDIVHQAVRRVLDAPGEDPGGAL